MEQKELTSETDIKKKVKEFIIKNFLLQMSDTNLNDDDSLLEQGVIDSTGVLELVNFIETTFNFRVEDEELVPDNLDSVNKLINYIKTKV